MEKISSKVKKSNKHKILQLKSENRERNSVRIWHFDIDWNHGIALNDEFTLSLSLPLYWFPFFIKVICVLTKKQSGVCVFYSVYITQCSLIIEKCFSFKSNGEKIVIYFLKTICIFNRLLFLYKTFSMYNYQIQNLKKRIYQIYSTKLTSPWLTFVIFGPVFLYNSTK